MPVRVFLLGLTVVSLGAGAAGPRGDLGSAVMFGAGQAGDAAGTSNVVSGVSRTDVVSGFSRTGVVSGFPGRRSRVSGEGGSRTGVVSGFSGRRSRVSGEGGSRTGQSPTPGFTDAVEAARELPRLHSLLASWRGELVLERYFNGARATRGANVKSVSKSLISALVGVAIERGLIPGPETPIRTYFPQIANDRDVRKRDITIEDLLTMRSGLQSTSNRYYGSWVQSRNWVQHALSRPLLSTPGTQMDYSTGNTHLLSAILTRATGKSTWQFAQEVLARPLGFALSRWPQDPQGIYFGGNDMVLTPRQMLAFGELYLNNGRAGGKQVVPEGWIERSFIPRGASRISGQRYGYGWWMRELAGHQSYYAWGFGGQYIILVPEIDLIVVTTSASTVAEDRRSHRRTLFELVEDLVVAPVAVVHAE